MQLLLGDYAQGFNRRHRRVGHLFQGRYKSLLVEDGDYFLECSRYIHLNPSRADIARPAELYPWSSYRAFVGGPCVVDWVATERTLGAFESPDHYRQFVESGRDEPPVNPFERAKAGFVLGGEAFVEKVRGMLAESPHENAQATLRALARAQGSPSPAAVRAAVADVFGDLSACQRRRLEMFALRAFTWLSAKEIGDAVGTAAGAVSKAHKQIGARLAQDAELARRLRLIADGLDRPPRPDVLRPADTPEFERRTAP